MGWGVLEVGGSCGGGMPGWGVSEVGVSMQTFGGSGVSGEAAWLLLLCDGPDQPRRHRGEDKDLRGSLPSSGWSRLSCPASGTPTEHGLASTGYHTGL